MLKTSTAFRAMETARTAMDQTQTTVLSVQSATLSYMMACVLKSALKGLTMKMRQTTVKVGRCYFLQNVSKIEVD